MASPSAIEEGISNFETKISSDSVSHENAEAEAATEPAVAVTPVTMAADASSPYSVMSTTPTGRIPTPFGSNNEGHQYHLSHLEKTRLKKLQKKAKTIETNRKASGFTRIEEKNEFLGLIEKRWGSSKQEEREKEQLHYQSAPNFGPCLSFKKGSSRQHIDASEHRDLFFFLLSNATENAASENSARKRKREETITPSSSSKNNKNNNLIESTQLASWISLHNPALVEQVAVLELATDTLERLKSLEGRIQNMNTATATNSNGKQELHIFKSVTRWFPDKLHVRTPCQTLMYTPQKKPPKKLDSRAVSTITELYFKLLDLVITKDEWTKEGFPTVELEEVDDFEKIEQEGLMPIETAADNTDSLKQKITMDIENNTYLPSEISNDAAIALVGKYRVECSNDQIESDELASYVSTSLVSSSSSTKCNEGTKGNQKSIKKDPKIFALDCEMVETTAGTELARVTLVQTMAIGMGGKSGITTKVVMDEIVRPKHSVTDYLTKYSGVTLEIMERPSVVDLEQVQASILSLVTSQDILVGHSIENDLRALRLIHERVVDTALVFRQKGARFKFSLRHLVSALLRKQIQRPNQPHCSEEDATAALELAVRRAVEGPAFGIWDRRQTNRLASLSQESTVVCIGPSSWLQEHVVSGPPNAIHALTCENIRDPNCKAVSSWLTGKTRKARLVWAQWSIATDNDEEAIDKLLKDLFSKLSRTTMVMINLQSNEKLASKLADERRVRLNPKATVGWTPEDEVAFSNAAREAQFGSTYWIGVTN